MRDFAHLDLSKVSDADFEALWALIDYTIEFARGARPRPEKAAFRKSGRLCWTSLAYEHATGERKWLLPKSAADLVKARQFFYVRAETDDLLYFGMINSLFSLMLEAEPSNHLHSILIPKSYLAHPNGWGPGVTCSLPGVDYSSGAPAPPANAAAQWQLAPPVGSK